MKTATITLMVLALSVAAQTAAVDNMEDMLAELEDACAYFPICDPDDPGPYPTLDEVIRRHHATTNEIVQGLKTIVLRHGTSETNWCEQVPRKRAVGWIGEYGSTNDLEYLATIMTNSADYAQQRAIGASLCITKHLPDLIPLARSIVTNSTVYSLGLRRWTQVILHDYCNECYRDSYIDDPAQHARIAAFFIERAALEHEEPLGADYMAYTLNPWYRHSQQRRDNLAALRPPGLTGKPAELYDAAQRDAAQEE